MSDKPIRHPGGRPSKLTEKVTRLICAALASGMTRKESCQLSGITSTTFNAWINRGKAGEDKYCEFLATVERSELASKVKCLSLLNKEVTKGDADTAKWILRHRFMMGVESKANIHIHASGDNAQVLVSDSETVARLEQLRQSKLPE